MIPTWVENGKASFIGFLCHKYPTIWIFIFVLFFTSCTGDKILYPPISEKSPNFAASRALYELADTPAIVDTNPSGDEILGRTPFQGIPSIAASKNGKRIFLAWYGNGETELPDNYIMVAYGDKSAQKWTDVAMTIKSPHCGKIRLFDPAVWRAPDGSIYIFWAQSSGLYKSDGSFPEKFNRGMWDRRGGVWYIKCDNPEAEKPVWSKPRRIADGVMMNKPTILKSGDWIFPIALFQTNHANDSFSQREGASLLRTSDSGKTFETINTVKIPGSDFPEHMFVERNDGSLWLLARSNTRPTFEKAKDGSMKIRTFGNCGIMEAFSHDGGLTFSKIKDSRIPACGTRFHISRLNSGNLLLVINDANNADWIKGKPRGKADAVYFSRNKMLAYISEDDGKTWKGGLMLDERPSLSYPDASQSADGSIYITYDRERYKQQEILVAKICEEDILAKEVVNRESKIKILANKGGKKFSEISRSEK